jgi:filamentous hemagglutinin
MRKITIADSKKSPEITDGETVLSNITGVSAGGKWDLSPIKTGGNRLDLDVLCGAANERCKIQQNVDGSPILDAQGKTQLKLDEQGRALFNPDAVGGLSLAKYIQTPEGQKMAGLTGGIQGAKGTFFGTPYDAGSWQDKLIDAFGGSHDMIGGKGTGLYDANGNIKRGMTEAERAAYDIWAAAAIVPSAPFAAAVLLPPEVWQAISIFLKGAR